MKIPLLWDMTQGQCGVVILDILPHEVEATTTRKIGIGFLRDQVSYLRTE